MPSTLLPVVEAKVGGAESCLRLARPATRFINDLMKPNQAALVPLGALLARPIRTLLKTHNNFWLSSPAYVLSLPPLPPPERTDTYTPSLTLSTRPQGPHHPLTPPVVELSNHVWKGSQGPVWQGCQGHHG